MLISSGVARGMRRGRPAPGATHLKTASAGVIITNCMARCGSEAMRQLFMICEEMYFSLHEREERYIIEENAALDSDATGSSINYVTRWEDGEGRSTKCNNSRQGAGQKLCDVQSEIRKRKKTSTEAFLLHEPDSDRQPNVVVMDDFANMEKGIVRELSCRLCLCSDVVKLKPLTSDVKRKIRKLFGVYVQNDDILPKAICHECLKQVGAMNLYSVKVEKTQKFLDFHKTKILSDKKSDKQESNKSRPITTAQSDHRPGAERRSERHRENAGSNMKRHSSLSENANRNVRATKSPKKKSAVTTRSKHMESMPLEEFVKSENLDERLLTGASTPEHDTETPNLVEIVPRAPRAPPPRNVEPQKDGLDPVVLINGRPARQGAALDRQVTLFYKMECCICHETGFNFKSLMQHYKDRHGVPGYVTCCEKKFHFFHPKRIIEHMAYHLQKDIFMCSSCHENFQSSKELYEHQNNGGRSEGKLFCPRCSARYPTYRELGRHLMEHRMDKHCDFCGKLTDLKQGTLRARFKAKQLT
ncbi:Zinc finger protein weckle [Eumeta japonica]|uniref:Zinc finger protein weckle n=1 Tax=Eumeta variegata TaxID=151549 RepID=A0A4C1XXY8_EUMVA|nr:Zinc finger protein weckle [Eumeta japonica]